jgi:RHS repeat-associated protein
VNRSNNNVLYKFEYNLSDHLGNVGVSFAGHSNGVPEVMQLTDYYPFGLVMNQQNFGNQNISLQNKYLYNGKELPNDALGGIALDWYDYGARMYDPVIGRFHTVDPLAEKYYFQSLYSYGHNNPVRFTDFMGMGSEDEVKKTEPLKFDLKEIATKALASVGLNIKTPSESTTEKLKEANAHNEKQAEIRKEIKEKTKEEVGNVADAAETIGTGIQAAGYAAAPITAGESLALVGVGKAIETTGEIINGTLDLSEGKVGKVIVKAFTVITFGALGRKVESMENAGKLSKESSGILQFNIDAKEKFVDAINNVVSDKNNEKKK